MTGPRNTELTQESQSVSSQSSSTGVEPTQSRFLEEVPEEESQGTTGDRPQTQRSDGTETDREVQTDEIENGSWAVLATVTLAGAGLLAGSQLLVAAATIPLWFVAVTAFAEPEDATVELERQFALGDGDTEVLQTGAVSGDPGEVVTVRTTVTNRGDEPLVDCRIADGVPDELPVISGTARKCVTLTAGESTTLEYDVAFRRGEHEFGDAQIRTRDMTGTMTKTWNEGVSGSKTLRCFPGVQKVPLDGGTNDYAGTVPSDDGGAGVEFYSIRDYEPGDSINAIDWRRYANIRELATVEYRAERSTRVVCLVDSRISQLRAQSERHLPALELSATAAERTFETLLESGHPSGIICFGERTQTTVQPGTEPATRARGLRLLEAVRDDDMGEKQYGQVRYGDPEMEIPAMLPGEAQIFLFSSLVDDRPVELAEQLRLRGYPVCVISPSVTGDSDETAMRLVSISRQNRLTEIRKTGARVIDWDTGEPIGPILTRAVSGVSSR